MNKFKKIIAVSSAKGGVGKSTTSVNLAVSLAKNHKVALLDADIYGPSLGLMMNLKGKCQTANNKLIPQENYGVKVISMAFLLEGNAAVSWRGPMAAGALVQLIDDSDFGEIDFLIIDMPPSTSDIQLTLGQKLNIDAALIITTPQEVAMLDTSRGIEMFNKMNIPILGVIENMAMHICSKCGEVEYIFGNNSDRLLKEYNLELLASLPLDKDIRIAADNGIPLALTENHQVAKIYNDLANKISYKIANTHINKPTLSFE